MRLTDKHIEDHIDQHGLIHLLSQIELICAEKAAHIRENWQDITTAESWDHDSGLIGNALRKVTNY
jgi:hypothetical protein